MNQQMGTFSAVLIKVAPGKEEIVFEYLKKKACGELTDRICDVEDRHPKCDIKGDRHCRILENEELAEYDPEDIGANRELLPCQHLKVITIAYLAGPYDFMVVLNVLDTNVTEKFIVSCLRNWFIRGFIRDTQTLAGSVRFPL